MKTGENIGRLTEKEWEEKSHDGRYTQKSVQIFASEVSRIYENSLDAVILYGSCARGDFESDSDIDILILLNVAPDKICEERKKR